MIDQLIGEVHGNGAYPEETVDPETELESVQEKLRAKSQELYKVSQTLRSGYVNSSRMNELFREEDRLRVEITDLERRSVNLKSIVAARSALP